MITVLTYGTFDLFHLGHLRLLQRAKSLGDRLVVGISSDAFNLEKKKTCVMNFAQRSEIVSSIRYVDLVFEETCWEQKESDIVKFQANIFVMGDDWKGKFDNLRDFCSVVYLPRTPDISTTQIKIDLSTNWNFKK